MLTESTQGLPLMCLSRWAVADVAEAPAWPRRPISGPLGAESGPAEPGDGGDRGNGAKSHFRSLNGEIIGCLGAVKTIFIDENIMFGQN